MVSERIAYSMKENYLESHPIRNSHSYLSLSRFLEFILAEKRFGKERYVCHHSGTFRWLVKRKCSEMTAPLPLTQVYLSSAISLFLAGKGWAIEKQDEEREWIGAPPDVGMER